ncbi:AMP-binding protein [Hyphomicrobium sp. D-2]|uniref:AMP-binding protein n=1 Tax=Hyphomicrobium sp. D-2 TaxID=3041621 RepID=UPI0024567BC3|nr:AMP-binding protein [Hyphomicrobium sp. D-2]MDH4981071.1 AMP-binding protein [Hyphomicrobium sp. D-2]
MTAPFNAADARRSLFSGLVAAATAYGRDGKGERVILEDADGNTLTYKRLILSSLVLGRRLAKLAREGENVGVLLPNAVGLPVTILGLNAYGRVAAILNFSAGRRALTSAIATAQLRTVLTSRRFVEVGGFEDLIAALSAAEYAPGQKTRIVYLEDVRASIGIVDKIAGALRALRAKSIYRANPADADRPAVVLFTSGTEGAPKGVVLTNSNIVANVNQSRAHLGKVLSPGETLLNPLPIFHSFGLTAGTFVPIFAGVKCALYPSPLHYKQIPKSIRKTQATLMVATDTFVSAYARAAEPGDLDSLKYAVCGAEKVKEPTRQLVAPTGVEILEGYGVTETSPVLACNLPETNRYGTVGRLLPGMEVRLEDVPGLSDGKRLTIRGPNVMAGYLLPDRPGVLVRPRDGWHDTGDIVSIDDGFVSIRGRAKRFAKLGGEMVSLAAVEGLACALWPDAQHVVLSFPDPRKGEQLLLVTDQPNASKDALLAHARGEGFSELWVPKSVLIVDAVPLLATGKVDLQATVELARPAQPAL